LYTYLLLNLFTISVPLLRSFDSRVSFYKSFSALFPAIAITGTFFIIWDVIFTKQGIWGFNSRYLIGVEIVNLPLEEWLFFFTVPYACVFIYVVLNYFLKKDPLTFSHKYISIVLILFLSVFSVIYSDRLYTITTFSILLVFLVMHAFILKTSWMGRFYLAYAVAVLPFFMVNGILTGSFIEEEVVWYNNLENLGIRMFTIPLEDLFYGMLLILMNITIFEWIKARKSRNQPSAQLLF
jgi:lycopene cyclase domain-containing protein